MTNDSATTDTTPTSDPQASAAKPLRQNPKWVGPILAFFLPGSAHFLSGQYRLGVLLFLAWYPLVLLPFLSASISGVVSFYVTVGLIVVYFLYFFAVLISSWRPTRRLGCSGWLLFIVILLFFNFFFDIFVFRSCSKTYVAETFTMNGLAMAPTMVGLSKFAPEIQYNDRIVVNKWIYRVSDPKRGDVVIFKTNFDDEPQNWTMRIVGLPGETVDIEPPYALINGERLTEPPIFAKIASQQDGFAGYCTAPDWGIEVVPLPLTLGADEYFVLGDNSPYSRDSRFIGPVRRQNITGKVIRIFYPFDRIREIE